MLPVRPFSVSEPVPNYGHCGDVRNRFQLSRKVKFKSALENYLGMDLKKTKTGTIAPTVLSVFNFHIK